MRLFAENSALKNGLLQGNCGLSEFSRQHNYLDKIKLLKAWHPIKIST
jgi:hypothetical protein